MNDARAQEEIDALIARLFSAFDNRGGATPTLAGLTDCFADKAVIARRSDAGADVYTVDEFARPRIALLTDGTLVDFHEVELSATTQSFGGIAIRTSRYGKSGVFNGADYRGFGSKCFQLVETVSGWRILSLAWVDDPVSVDKT